MKQFDEQTIEMFSKRDNSSVTKLTLLFALLPAVFLLVAAGIHFSMGSQSPDFSGSLSILWVPFCFLTIPPIHYLCRRVKQLEARLDELTAFVKAKAQDEAT